MGITLEEFLYILNESASIQIFSNTPEETDGVWESDLLWEGEDRDEIPEEYLDMRVWDTYPYEGKQIICI